MNNQLIEALELLKVGETLQIMVEKKFNERDEHGQVGYQASFRGSSGKLFYFNLDLFAVAYGVNVESLIKEDYFLLRKEPDMEERLGHKKSEDSGNVTPCSDMGELDGLTFPQGERISSSQDCVFQEVARDLVKEIGIDFQMLNDQEFIEVTEEFDAEIDQLLGNLSPEDNNAILLEEESQNQAGGNNGNEEHAQATNETKMELDEVVYQVSPEAVEVVPVPVQDPALQLENGDSNNQQNPVSVSQSVSHNFFVCTVCWKFYTRASCLKKHFSKWHVFKTGKKLCPFCKRYIGKKYWPVHVRKLHSAEQRKLANQND